MSRILERSAAHFAGVMKGDVLLQVDDRVVLDKDDIARFFPFFFFHVQSVFESVCRRVSESVCPWA